MFNTLFRYSTVVERHRAAPLPDERSAYLNDLARQGMSRQFLKDTAGDLLVVANALRLRERSGGTISSDEIDQAANQWVNRRERRKNNKPKRDPKAAFISMATRWLRFIGRLEPDRASRFEPKLVEFDDYMRKERGLSAVTRRGRCWFINHFLNQVNPVGDSLANLSILAIDTALRWFGEQGGYSRATLQTGASHLRAFFRYGATHGWCGKDLADAIKSPRVYSMDSLPAGPSWEDVNRLLALTEGDSPTDIRDRPIIMLLAIYGLRAGEVKQLRLDDFDWKGELLSVSCSKTRRTRIFPLSRPVGDAVLRYIKLVRPHSHHREVFLTRCAPIRPLREIWPIVGVRLRRLGAAIPHHGPHALRHACATHLLAEGFSLKQIGDQLGHLDADSTRIYAKVDMASLRKVADVDLEGLL